MVHVRALTINVRACVFLQANKKTEKATKKARSFPVRKYALKA